MFAAALFMITKRWKLKNPSTDEWKTNSVYTHHGTPLSPKTEGGTDRCCNGDHAEMLCFGKKPNPKGHMRHEPLYRKKPQQANL